MNIQFVPSTMTVSDSRRDYSWCMLNGSMCPYNYPCCLVCHPQLSGDRGAVVGAR
ncbi:hypothetical protein Hanom_Chr05g00450921 [Helianthus anomalus]